MDIEKAMQFIAERQARTEAILQGMAEDHKRLAEDHKRVKATLEANQIQFGEDLLALTGVVRQVAEAQQRHEERFQRHREEYQAFHLGVEERFNALIKMMDEWIRERRSGNGAS